MVVVSEGMEPIGEILLQFSQASIVSNFIFNANTYTCIKEAITQPPRNFFFCSSRQRLLRKNYSRAVVAHNFNPSTWEAEAVGSL